MQHDENNEPDFVSREEICLPNVPLEEKTNIHESNEQIVSESQVSIDESLMEDLACVVCFAEKKNVLMMPCRHICVCATCAASNLFKLCPICREEVIETMHVFV